MLENYKKDRQTARELQERTDRQQKSYKKRQTDSKRATRKDNQTSRELHERTDRQTLLENYKKTGRQQESYKTRQTDKHC